MADALPLEGIRVLDISTYIAAPAAAVVLGDFGADVIKVEQPGEGDPNRHLSTVAAYPKSPVNYPWHMDARNKRSLAVDLKHADGLRVLHKLVARTDVLITNFPLPVRARLRLGYDDLAPLNPRLVYASLTGYGEAGPDSHQPGFDATAYFARTGIFDALRYEGQPPHFSLPASGDRATAMAFVSAIMMGLYRRERTGKGGMVGTSLMASGLWSNGVYAQAALVGSILPLRPPRHRPRSALANIYRTRDDRWIQLTLPLEERMWPGFCRALGRPELETDVRFASTEARRARAAELTALLDELFATEDWPVWRKRLREEKITFGIINRLQDIPEDPQLRAGGAVVETGIEDMPFTVAAPLHLDGAAPRQAEPAPELGEHSDEILAEAGYGTAEIAALRKCGVVG
jgi:formyl-CoA transferase